MPRWLLVALSFPSPPSRWGGGAEGFASPTAPSLQLEKAAKGKGFGMFWLASEGRVPVAVAVSVKTCAAGRSQTRGAGGDTGRGRFWVSSWARGC